MVKVALLGILLATLILPSELLAGNKLHFAMAGPRNWAIADFSIAIGDYSDTTRTIVYVNPKAYDSVAALISRIGSKTTTYQDPVFLVTEFCNLEPKTEVFVTDKVVGDIMRKVALSYRTKGEAVPAIVDEVAKVLAY